jgi:hypothetical protein
MIAAANAAETMTLNLVVTDAECLSELFARESGTERDFFALSALRVGVLALRQAAGVVDHQAIRNEGDRLVEVLRSSLSSHYERTTTDISSLLEKYFDVNDGALPQRIERLVKKDGDLESVLSRYLNGGTSTLAVTLEKHLGKDSVLLQTLSPDRSKGVIAALNEVLAESVRAQNEVIAGQFTLDNADSALSRLIRRISDENGQLRKGFGEDVSLLRKEFSLDNRDGSLSRLISQVEQSRKAIVQEFSPENESSVLSRIGKLLTQTNETIQGSLTLDDEKSPLFRLKRELVGVVEELNKKNAEFHTEVREAITAITVKRQESKRSTIHGREFHSAVEEFVGIEARRLNDIFEQTGEVPGVISRCKKGDAVVTLGPESQAPGVRIVFEAKGNKSYSLKQALDELHAARQNRDSRHGVFVFDRNAAPDGLDTLSRYGSDIIVVWDAEDATTDVNLRAAYSIARCIAVQESVADTTKKGERVAIELAIDAITRNLEALGEIERLANTTRNNGEKIASKAVKLKSQIEQQLESVSEHVVNL